MPIKKIVSSLVFLISILVSSCITNDKSLGSQFVSDDYILKVDTIIFDVPLTVKSLDSIQGYTTSSMIFGSLCDPTFGPMYSGTASIIVPFSDSTYFGINPVLKSVYVNLFVDSTVIYRPDQEGIQQNIHIYKLTSNLDSTQMFNTSITEADYDPVPLNLGSPMFFGDDSVRIYLREDFGKELLSCTMEDFDSLTLFYKKIKGFYLTCDTPGNEEGGRLNYMALGSSTLYVDYYLTDPERNYNHFDTTETFSFGYSFAVNTIRTSSDHLATEEPGENLYIESMSGVKPYITGIALKSMINKWMEANGYSKESLLLSRATLDLPYETDLDDYDVVNKQYPQMIFPCYKESSPDSLQFFEPISEIYTSSSIGTIVRDLKKYSCDITSYVQDLIFMDDDAVTSTQDIYLSSILSYSDSYGNLYYDFDNMSYNKAVINGPGAIRKPTLKLTYAILNY